MTIEITPAMTKDVQLMNILVVQQDILRKLMEATEHVGNHIHETAKKYRALSAKQDLTESEEAEYALAKHLLDGMGKIIKAGILADEIGQVGYDLVNISSTVSLEDAPVIKAEVAKTKPIQDVMRLMKETDEEKTVRILMKTLMQGLDDDEFVKSILNGN